MKKKTKNLILVLIIIILIWCILFTVDMIRIQMKLDPIFCYPAVVYMDGGSMEAYGLGYKINKYFIYPSVFYEVGPFWMIFDENKALSNFYNQ